MPSKKVTISPKPQERVADDWVNGSETAAAPTETLSTPAQSGVPEEVAVVLKRLTIDIPEELHARIKSQCALRRSKMADEIRVLLESHFST